jgi:hypothetical protein
MNQGQKYYQLIPEKVYNNLSTISDLLSPDIKGFSIDNLKEVISIVACHVRKEDGPAPLSIWSVNKLVPQGQFYLTGLINLGIIKRSGQFVPKANICYQYDFAPEYQSKYLSFPLNNAKLILRIQKVWDELRKQDAKSIRGHSDQVKYLNKLTIDESFKDFLESNYTSETDQYNSILASAMRIINKIPLAKIDNTSGRFHSNITNMAKGLRPYLRINNEPLANIDVKNSQPYLSTIILTYPSKVAWLTKNPAFALLLQTLKVSVNKEDVKKYISLVISGQLYEYLMQEFSKEGMNLTRSETKIQVLRILFARNRMPKDEVNRKARQIFKDGFPTVHRIFSKVRGSEKGDKFQNFKRFAILLQRIESYLMLDVILKRIYKELPGTIAVTVHDSIMTGILTNNLDAVKKIMIDEFTFFIGFAPKIQIEMIIEDKEEIERKEITLNQYDITNLVSLN